MSVLAILWCLAVGLICVLLGMAIGQKYADNTIKRLRKHNSEMMTELRDGTTVTETQLTEFRRITQEHLKLNEEQNNVITYIRDDPYFKQYLGKHDSFSQLLLAILKSHPYAKD